MLIKKKILSPTSNQDDSLKNAALQVQWKGIHPEIIDPAAGGRALIRPKKRQVHLRNCSNRHRQFIGVVPGCCHDQKGGKILFLLLLSLPSKVQAIVEKFLGKKLACVFIPCSLWMLVRGSESLLSGKIVRSRFLLYRPRSYFQG